MKKKFEDYLIEHAKREFECANFDNTPLSVAMINFLEECSKFTNGDTQQMKQFTDILKLLIDRRPIVPITEKDFVEEIYKEKYKPDLKFFRCTRYEFLYKDEAGRYWDDRAIAYRRVNADDNERIYMYQSGNSSKQEVKLPYFPNEKLIILND